MGVIHAGTVEIPNNGNAYIEVDSEYDIVDITVSTTCPMTITGGPFNPQRGTGGVKQRGGSVGAAWTEGTIVDGEKTFNITPLVVCRKKRNTFKIDAANASGAAGFCHIWVINSSGNM